MNKIIMIAIMLMAATQGVNAQVIYVDLGLPSKTLWADRNIGAESETDNGTPYIWGNNNKDARSMNIYKGNCFYSVPAEAFSNIGLSWQIYNVYKTHGENGYIPNRIEWAELFQFCKREWKVNYKGSGRSGLLVTGRNGNSIFLVATGLEGKHQDEFGYYYSAELHNRAEAKMTEKSHGFQLLMTRVQCGKVKTDSGVYNGLGIYMRPIKK